MSTKTAVVLTLGLAAVVASAEQIGRPHADAAPAPRLHQLVTVPNLPLIHPDSMSDRRGSVWTPGMVLSPRSEHGSH
jgi:hypothetical protein